MTSRRSHNGSWKELTVELMVEPCGRTKGGAFGEVWAEVQDRPVVPVR